MTSGGPRPAGHPRRAAPRRPAAARRGRRHHPRRRPRHHRPRCAAGPRRPWCCSAPTRPDGARRPAPAPARPGARGRARAASATRCSAARWPPAPSTSSSCPPRDAWLVELLTDVADGAPGGRRDPRRGRRVGRRRRDHVRERAGPDRPPRPVPPPWSTSTRSVPGSTGSVGPRRRARPADGARWDAAGRLARGRPRVAVAARRAARQGRAGGAHLGGRAPGARSTPRRCARCSRRRSAATTWWWSTCRGASTRWPRRWCPGATRCWWWPSRRSPGVASAGRVAARLRPLNQRLGLVVRGGGARRPGRDTSPTSSSSRWSPRCRPSAGSTSTSTSGWGRSTAAARRCARGGAGRLGPRVGRMSAGRRRRAAAGATSSTTCASSWRAAAPP